MNLHPTFQPDTAAGPVPIRRYPHPCARCGFCCVAMPHTCGLAAAYYGLDAIRKSPVCPALDIGPGDGKATCALVSLALSRGGDPQTMGIGAGCCIKATAYRDGLGEDFSGLPPPAKRFLALKLYQQKLDSLAVRVKVTS